MPNSQSHLFSLAQLLESAEQRQSSMPPPPPPPRPPEDDSGLIDILAMQARAREETSRESSRTPLPVVASTGKRDAGAARLAHTDPDLVAASAKRKQKHAMIGGVTAGIALIVFAIGFASSAPAPSAPRTAAVQAPAPVAPPPPPLALVPPAPPPPAEAATATTAEPVAADATEPTAKPKTKKKKKKSSHASHATHAGASLMKVISGGTAP